MNEDQAALITEQVKHAIDLMRSDIDAVKATAAYRKEFVDHRLNALENQATDHESRIRATTDGVTQFKLIAGLGGGGGILALIGMIRTMFLGG